jgi:integrase
LTAGDVEAWLDAHEGWNGGTRTAVQALKRAINYAVACGRIPRNPIRGYKTDRPGRRITYFTPEQEAAMYEHSRPALATAIRVCIRTGARPLVEFGSLEARHVVETNRGQAWVWPKEETKTRKADRTIYVPEDIAGIARRLAKEHPTGPLFRNARGTPWTNSALKSAFDRLRKRLRSKGIVLDKDAVFYSCRHTYAKRMLGGYWGKPVTLEVLAGLMGNTPKVCWDHYAKWCDQYTDPLWDAVS